MRMRYHGRALPTNAKKRGITFNRHEKRRSVLSDDGQSSRFMGGQRWIFLWRKREALPCGGLADEQVGTLHYNMQGAISVLPSSLKGAGGTFQGAWSGAGTFESMDQAFDLVKAWLLDSREVDDLPGRSVRRYGV